MSKYKLEAITVFFMTFLCLGIPFSDAGARTPTQIVMTLMLPRDKEPLGEFTYLIYREAFQRLGLELICVYRPPLRGGVEAELGSLDGELGRGKDYGISHPNLVRVGEHAMELNVSAFALLPTIKLDGWEALRHMNYRVEYRMGMQIPQSKLEKILAPPLLSTVPTSLQGLKKLVAGRTDVYIDFDDVVDVLIVSENFSGAKKIHKIGLMEKVPIFAYLHRSQEDLGPKLSLVLKEMKKDGLIEKFRKEAFSARPSN